MILERIRIRQGRHTLSVFSPKRSMHLASNCLLAVCAILWSWRTQTEPTQEVRWRGWSITFYTLQLENSMGKRGPLI